MLQGVDLILKTSGFQQWLAQIPGRVVDTPEEAALVFSGPRFFTALIAGVVLAFGFQLLLTNLSLAAGISYLGNRSDSHDDRDAHSHDSLGTTVRKIGTAAGLWTLVTVSLALFIACLLAVKLSLINSTLLGAIVGLTIWGLYFSLLVWLSSTTVGSLVGSVVNAAVSGFQAIIGTATTAIGAKVARDQIVSTTEAAAAAVRREIANGIDPQGLRENLEDYLDKLRPAELNVQHIRQEFERLLNEAGLESIADADTLANFDRPAVEKLISDRTDLSKRDAKRIIDELEAVWKQQTGKLGRGRSNSLGGLVDYLKSSPPGQQVADELGKRLDSLLGEFRQSQGQQSQPSQASNVMSQVINGLMGVALGRTDLSELDVEKIVSQLKNARSKIGEQATKVVTQVQGETPPPSYSVVRADVENYLLNTYSWQMTREAIDRDFRQVLYDPEASATQIRQELDKLTRQDFVELLRSRGVFSQDRIEEISSQLDGIRRDVAYKVSQVEEREKTLELEDRLATYLRLAPRETLINQDLIAGDLKPMLADADANAEQLRGRFAHFSRMKLMGFLDARTDLTWEEKQQVIVEIENIVRIVVADADSLQAGIKARSEAQWQKVEEYLRQTHKAELNPEGIKRDFQTLLEDPQAGIQDIRYRLSQFDRDTLVQLLTQRGDLSEAEVNNIVDSVESSWHQVRQAPGKLAAKAAEQYDKVSSAVAHVPEELADYLRNTGRSELNPEGIRRDLELLFSRPELGARAWRDRISQVDRETLVKLLSQRGDLSEQEVNQTIDGVQSTIRGLIRAPRRLAARTQSQLQDFSSTLADYLRNTGKAELNPEGIQRDLQLLLNDPRLGAARLSDRLSHIDRETLVSLLSQRQDMTEEEANQIVDRVLSVRDRLMEQVKAVQWQVQKAIDSVFDNIRNYLNSLERPELNYDSIKRDVRTLFNDPQAGFEALRDRLSQFDRDTLIALLSSREDISPAQAERIVGQIERSRDNILGRAQWVQDQVQQRLDEVKYQAQRQVEETRKAAATAAWWLFATALTSAALSAIAGSLAVGPY
ncbi:MAG: MFS transporter [Cyanosarcina radialis HA8281-LM2]|nr:MFS transporter [Cyanosarcina radialis HA8281-LM2]